jgi:TonB-linked SusC/RagA family outer membrane protein
MKKHLLMILCIGFALSGSLYAQNASRINLSGKVTDALGQPVIGVSVTETGTTNGAITDLDGDYHLTVAANAKVQFSYLGYKSVTQIATSNSLNIVLEEDISELDEVIVVAYGTQRKKDLTGAVSVIDTKAMQKLLSPTLGAALQGQATGVSVTTSGRPGAGADIRIRGVGSLSNVGPLYVIDGMVNSITHGVFDVNNVASIQVLKDASATALYGARGANGVILITTKKGQDGPTKIDFSANLGVQEISKRLEMMNSLDFLRINRLGYENANKEWPGEPQQGQVLVNTDWQDAFMKTALTQDYNLTVSGGNANGNHLFSFNYYNQDGVVVGPSHERFSLRVNTESRKGIFTAGENLLVTYSTTDLMEGSPFIDLARMPPIIPIYDPENESGYGYGSGAYQTYGTNPIGAQETRHEKQTNARAIGNAFIQLEPLKGLLLKTNIGVEYHNYFDRRVEVYDQIRYLDKPDYKNYMLERRGDQIGWIWENTAFYSKQIDVHHFDVLAGYTAQRTYNKGHAASGRNLTDGYWVLSQVSKESDVSGTDSEYAMASILGRINYDYAGKYLFQGNIRRDGSSRFGKNYRYGTYPSASLGWRISEESFLKNAKFLNDAKIRFSYGTVGDQQALGLYQYTTYITTGEGAILGPDETYYPGAIQKGRANPDLRWEEKTTTNVGLDFTVLDQHLYGTLEYFLSDSKDLLVLKTLSWTSGTDINPWANFGRIENKGFEILLGWRETNKEFKYNLALNLTSVKTTVKSLGDDTFYAAGIGGVNYSEVGRSIGDFYVVRTDGIFQSMDEVYAHTVVVKDDVTGAEKTVLIQPNAQPGDIRYKDLNQDGIINEHDKEFVGSPLPKFEGGLNFSAEYKNFDFNLFLVGVAGNKIFNNVKYWLERMDETSNLPKNLKPWTPDNPSTTTPRPFMGPNDNTLVTSDRWIENGDYLRLKNLQIGYSIPQSALAKLGLIQNARVYAGVQNLLTLTGYSGFDPEISGGNIYGKGNDDGHFPPVRTYSFGLQVTF